MGTSYKRQKKDTNTKKYDLLIDNQVDFVQSAILDGLISNMSLQEEKKTETNKKKKVKQQSDTDSDNKSSSDEMEIDEAMLREAEKNLSPEERKRIEL